MKRATLGLIVLLTLTVCTCVSRSAFAQHASESLLEHGSEKNAVRVTTELDPALALGLGYMRVVDLPPGLGGKKLSLHGDVTALWGFSSWDVTTGASLRLRQKRGFDLQITTDLDLKLFQDDVRSGASYGYGVGLRPGWFGDNCFVAADLSLRGNFAQTVSHSVAYKEQFLEAVDGTYLSDTLFFFPGVATGVRFAERVVFGARFAWRVPRDMQNYSPYYLPYTFDFELGLMF